MSRRTFFADVIVPLAVPQAYTYRVPFELNDQVCTGSRVIVQFGRNKLYTAIVKHIHEKAPESYQAKYIHSLLDNKPIVNAIQLRLWEWMASYYMCTEGEVMNAALPAGLKLSSETRIIAAPGSDLTADNISDDEYLILEALENRKLLTLTEVREISGKKSSYALIRNMIDKRLIMLEEELKERYKPKKENYIRFPKEYNEIELHNIFDSLEKAPKQLEMLMVYMDSIKRIKNPGAGIKRAVLVKKAGTSDSVLNAMIKKGVFENYECETGRLPEFNGKTGNTKDLADFQEEALTHTRDSFANKEVTLLHGVTGSGKTEIYIHLIEEALKKGKQVLYLLPEIALTTQIINRLRGRFGEKVGVYHSKFNHNERVEVWNKVLSAGKDAYSVILGARSSVFLPFSNLGLVIVDEEHENSYKQFDPAPRYNARDTAIFLASLHNAKTLLGSATPAIESYFNAGKGKYGYVELKKRFGGIQLPEVLCADISDEKKKKKMTSHFSSFLLKQMKEVLERDEQIILFQNRRGFAPMLECEVCGHVPQCKHCDVSLTYHKYSHQLKCHYCGSTVNPPKQCGACGSPKITLKGFGTEKIEEELSMILPEARISRMDLETTRAKHAYQQIINDFEERNIDILVGTQMVTKGLDFDKVALVGVLNADNMLNFPDFRSYERSYQLMAQVSGRSGRKGNRGKVIIQSYNPNHSIIRYVIANNYEGMYSDELLDRKNFHYPPFYRLIRITVKHKEAGTTNNASRYLATLLKKAIGKKRILGPEYAMVPRVKDKYLMNILIKLERDASPKKAKILINEALNEFQGHKDYRQVILNVDVDPM